MVQWLIVLAEGNLALITRTYDRRGREHELPKVFF